MLLSSLIPPISPSFTGVLVGAVSGALAFVVFALVVARRRSRDRQLQQEMENVGGVPAWLRDARVHVRREVFTVPPYPVPPQSDVDLDAVATRAFQRPRGGFSPQLSASSLAKMGLHVGPFGQKIADTSEDEDCDLSDLEETPAVIVSPCIILSDEPKKVHPLGIIKSSSLALLGSKPAAAPQDDCPTEIGETFFDVKPNPLASRPRPKIRPISPGAPRFGG